MKITTHSICRMVAAGAAGAALALAPTAAFADTYTGTPPPSVLSVDNVAPAQRVRASNLTPATSATDAASLPVTGSDLASLAMIGFGALGVGTVLVLKTRTRQPQDA